MKVQNVKLISHNLQILELDIKDKFGYKKGGRKTQEGYIETEFYFFSDMTDCSKLSEIVQ